MKSMSYEATVITTKQLFSKLLFRLSKDQVNINGLYKIFMTPSFLFNALLHYDLVKTIN